MLAVIKTGGKQYKVKAKDKIKVEKLVGSTSAKATADKEEGSEVVFDKVLLRGDDKSVEVGTPYIKGAKVKAKVLKQGRAKKVEVVHFKSKTRQHKKYGHRQPYTELEILSIS